MPATADEQKTIQRLEIQVADLRKVLWACAIWGLSVLLSVVVAAYQAGQIHATVATLQRDFAEVKTDLKEMRKDTAELKADFKSQAGQLDRIEKALAHNPPSGPKPTP
jgi:hypothetical protein